jgi:predicted nucleic-acid-binding protein
VIEQVMQTVQFEIAKKDVIWKAFEDFSEGAGDFSDYSIGHANERAGVKTTLTFDRPLKGCPRFTLL